MLLLWDSIQKCSYHLFQLHAGHAIGEFMLLESEHDNLANHCCCFLFSPVKKKKKRGGEKKGKKHSYKALLHLYFHCSKCLISRQAIHFQSYLMSLPSRFKTKATPGVEHNDLCHWLVWQQQLQPPSLNGFLIPTSSMCVAIPFLKAHICAEVTLEIFVQSFPDITENKRICLQQRKIQLTKLSIQDWENHAVLCPSAAGFSRKCPGLLLASVTKIVQFVIKTRIISVSRNFIIYSQ